MLIHFVGYSVVRIGSCFGGGGTVVVVVVVVVVPIDDIGLLLLENVGLLLVDEPAAVEADVLNV